MQGRPERLLSSLDIVGKYSDKSMTLCSVTLLLSGSNQCRVRIIISSTCLCCRKITLTRFVILGVLESKLVISGNASEDTFCDCFDAASLHDI